MMAGTDVSPSLYYMIYVSSATERLSQTQLLDLLKLSRRKNEARGLTGMLLYRDGMYLQYLEGRREDVEELVGELKNDSRHHAFQTIREGHVVARLFPDWTMAYKNLTGMRSADVPGYSERLQAQNLSKKQLTGEPGDDPPTWDPAQLLVNMLWSNAYESAR